MSGKDLDEAFQIEPKRRVCVVCGGLLRHHRSDARHCSSACRAEASLIRGILSGKRSSPYDSLAARLAAKQRRRKRPLGRREGALEDHRDQYRHDDAPGNLADSEVSQ